MDRPADHRAVASRRRSVEATSTHGRKGELSRCQLTLCLVVCVLLALVAGPVAHPATPQAKKDAQIIAFFAKHPRLARKPAAQQLLWSILARLQKQVRSLQSARSTPEGAIRHVFGPYAEQALAVAWCESRHSVWASNGQYLGLFQMGDYARGRYGHGDDALTQARAAYRYFVDSGRNWGPWSCKPW